MNIWRGRTSAGKGSRVSASDPLQPIDLILSGTSTSVAVYAAAASLSSDKNSIFFLWVVIAGTLCSGLIVWLLGKSRFIQADATAYTIVALLAGLAISNLNHLAPDAIYTGPLMMAGVLSWMLALGSFTVWRDQTMLFQAVPAIALFGLVGCYDTFRESVIYFFVFLVCQVTLLARAHGRVMLRQARSSGVEALEMTAMRRGPWRWMAGPEWALASALTIVLISVVGAPLLRESASSFSGLVRYAPPISPLTQTGATPLAGIGTRIGTGPNVLNDVPVMRLVIEEPMYLRGFAFGRYVDGAWYPRTPRLRDMRAAATPRTMAVDAIKHPRRVRFRVEPLLALTNGIAVPGEVVELDGNGLESYQRNIGGGFSPRSDPPLPPLEGVCLVPGRETQPRDSDDGIGQFAPEYLEKSSIPAEVSRFAERAVKGAQNDFEKAAAIKRAIESTAKYNLNALETPKGKDPVSFFLFKSKEGYCDLFASAMTLMARSAGLPARYVTGFYPFQSEQDNAGRYIVRQKDAHAWCEIFFKDAGWVVFDATEGADAVDGSGRGSWNDRPFWSRGWFLMLAVFAGGGGLGYGAYYLAGYYRRVFASQSRDQRRAAAAARRLRRQLTQHYSAFEHEIYRLVRRPRAIGETLNEYTSAAGAKLGSRAPIAEETRAAFATALYAISTIDEGAVAKLKLKVQEFRGARRSKPR
jgi:transglutaminase-like putative cysteine protease